MSLDTSVNKRSEHLRKMILASLFVALAYVVRLAVPAINVSFLTFEFKDAILAIGALYLGPIWAGVMSVLIALLELPISSTGWYGMVMNFAAAATFTVTTSLIYRYFRTMQGAVMGVVTGAFALVCVMLPLNLWITPFYYTKFVGIPMDTATVADMIPELLLPFNAAKGIMNAGVTLMLYKPVMRALQAARLTKRTGEVSAHAKNRTWVSVLMSLALVAFGAVVFFVTLSGKFSVGYIFSK